MLLLPADLRKLRAKQSWLDELYGCQLLARGGVVDQASC